VLCCTALSRVVLCYAVRELFTVPETGDCSMDLTP
jgi:hypothetical protein